MITHQNFQDGNLREAAKLARNAYAVSAQSTKTLARAETGRKSLVQGLSLSFEKHEVVLQFDMSQFHSQFHQLKSAVNMPFVMCLFCAVLSLPYAFRLQQEINFTRTPTDAL